MHSRLSTVLGAAVLFQLTAIGDAAATEKARLFLKTGSKSPQQVAEALRSMSLQNCLAFASIPFGLDEVAAGLECNENKDVFAALSEIAAKLDGIQGLTLVSIEGK
jgi:hypothetical protein